MIDIGDPVPNLAVTVKDPTGAPADAGAIVLTLTLPDATTTAPTVTHTGTGAYSATYVTTLVGRYTVRWVATGANACTFADAFDVAPADPGGLFSISDARAILRLPAGDTGNDDLLRFYVAAVTAITEHLCGKQVKASTTRTFDGGSAGIILPSNLISVDTVIENTLTLAATDYTVDPVACILYRGSPLAVFSFIPGIQNITVTYTRGVTVIAPNVQAGAELTLRHFWQGTQQGNRPAFGAPDSAAAQQTNVLGYLVPNAAMAFFEASPPSAGFA